MMDLTFTEYYAPILIFIIAAIVVWAALKKLKVIESTWVNAVIAIIVAIIITSSKSSVAYLFHILPYFVVILVATFVLLIVLVFVAKDLEMFKKPIAWIAFILGLILIITMAFGHFPTALHMFPGTTDATLSPEMQDVKSVIDNENFKNSIIFIIVILIVGFFLMKGAG